MSLRLFSMTPANYHISKRLLALLFGVYPTGRARKLYTSARIYEWKFGKGEWKLAFASPTGRVDFFGFVIIFEEKKRTN